MWICLNDAFLSIVRKDCGPNELLVRARREGDIERVFPRVKVEVTPLADYLYRAVPPKENSMLSGWLNGERVARISPERTIRGMC